MSEIEARRLMGSDSIHERNRSYRAVRQLFVKAGKYDEFLAWYFRGQPLSKECKTLLNKSL